MTPCEARNRLKELAPAGSTLHTRTLNKTASGNREVGIFLITPGQKILALAPLAARMLSHRMGKNEGVCTGEGADRLVEYLGNACYSNPAAFLNSPF